MGLFHAIQPEEEPQAGRPLADRMRPQTLDEFIGQEDLLGPGKPLRMQIERDDLSSMLLWGPPGCGKTTLARIIARTHASRNSFPSARCLSGIKEIKEVMAKAEAARRYGRRTIVFVDEVHRFNRAQQDAFLPHVEAGNILLIGATTENPSFEVIAPLLSRMKVYVLQAHTDGADRDAAASARSRTRSAGWARNKSRRAARFSSASPSLRMATRAPPTTRWKRWCWAPRRTRTAAACFTRHGSKTCCRANCCPTINPAKNIST